MKKALPDPTVEPELSLEVNLPSGMESFSVRWLGTWFKCSAQHWINLVESGAIRAIDLRSPGSSKSMIRIPRAELVKYLATQDAADIRLR
jgi:hypothetical protein